MTKPIVYAMMTQNRLKETIECINLMSSFVDETVIIDGGSIDDSLLYLRNRSDVHVFLHPWRDNFSEQRNNYIKRAREVIGTDAFWILVSDPDEQFEPLTATALYEVQEEAERLRRNLVTFRCRSVTLKGEKRVWENLDDYWKGLFFKYEPGVRYAGNPHEHLVFPSGMRIMQTEYLYEHKKQENAIWHRGCRNMYVGGGGPNLNNKNKLWVELKEIVKTVYERELSWHEYEVELMKGNLDQRLKDWMIKVRKEEGWDGASEHREAYKYYFRILHPEEEPEELRGEHIP